LGDTDVNKIHLTLLRNPGTSTQNSIKIRCFPAYRNNLHTWWLHSVIRTKNY